jgi:hypothetical protein
LLSCCMRKTPFVGFVLCFLGTAKSGALKANALPGGARRLAVRAVKAARFSRSSERSGRALTEEVGGPGAGFQQEGQRSYTARLVRWVFNLLAYGTEEIWRSR